MSERTPEQKARKRAWDHANPRRHIRRNRYASPMQVDVYIQAYEAAPGTPCPYEPGTDAAEHWATGQADRAIETARERRELAALGPIMEQIQNQRKNQVKHVETTTNHVRSAYGAWQE